MKRIMICMLFGVLSIDSHAQGFNVLLESTPTTCKGANDGSIELTVVGSGGTFTYEWTGPNGFTSTDKELTDLEAGSYEVEVTRVDDGNTDLAEIDVTESDNPLALSLDTEETKDAICTGEASGVIKVAASGGSDPISFSIRESDGSIPGKSDFTAFKSNDGLFDQLQPGWYDIAALDDHGCFQYIDSVEVGQPTALVVSAIESTNVTCKYADDGTIEVTATGGTPGYTYSIDGNSPGQFQTNSLFENLAAGSYDIWIRDSAGCLADSSIIEITQPETIFGIGKVDVTDVTCYGENSASATLVYTTATDPDHPIASIKWYDSLNAVIAEDTETVTGLSAGSYHVEVTDSFACSKSRSFEVLEPSSTLNLSLVSEETSNITCWGGDSGKITVTASGGEAPYLYAIKFNDGTAPEASGFTNFSPNDGQFTGLYANSYDIAVKDSYGCIRFVENITLTQPNPVGITYTRTFTTCDSITNAYINVSSITGGTGPYQTEWINEDDMTISSEQSIYNLSAGTYVLRVIDSKSCENDFPFTIEDGFTIEVTTMDVTCKDLEDGRAELMIGLDDIRDQEPLQIQWKDSLSQTINEYEDSLYIENLGPGSYSVEITDAFGCTKINSFTIEEPLDFLTVDSVTTKDVICKNESTGEISFYVSGGTPSYSYSIDGGSSFSPYATFSDLAAGTYDTWARDRNSCPIHAGTVTISEPSTQFGIDHVEVTNVSCSQAADGQATIVYTGDTDPDHPINSIKWYNDQDSLIGTESNTLDKLEGGVYHVEIGDEYGCTRSTSFEIYEPLEINLLSQINEIPCSESGTGLITITSEGGNGGYSFSWFKGTTPQITDADTLVVTEKGQYTVKVTDSVGCSQSKTFDIQVPDPIEITFEQTNVVCKDGTSGTIDAEVTGGTPPYRYSWKKNGASYIDVLDLDNLEAASYELTVLDDNDCQQTVTVDITEPATTFEINSSVQHVTCSGYGDGAITVTIVSEPGHPDAGYQYSWQKDGVLFAKNTKNLSDLDEGEYTIDVTDTYGCTKSSTITVEEKVAINLNAKQTNNSCPDESAGRITIDPSGGTGYYTVQWYNGIDPIHDETGDTLSNLEAGLYKVALSDDFGCNVTEEFEIIPPAPITVTDSIVNIVCQGSADGKISLDISGGTAPYSIVWTKNETFYASGSSSISALDTGSYTVTIQDTNSCTPYTDTYTITRPETTFELEGAVENISCHSLYDGKISLIIDDSPGHSATYDIQWTKNGSSFMSGTSELTKLGPGTYTATVSDEYTCAKSIEFELSDPDPIHFLPAITPITCVGASNGVILLKPTGGYGEFSANWFKNGQLIASGMQATGLDEGAYTVTLTDVEGCAQDSVIHLTDPIPIQLTETVSPVSCQGGNDGTIRMEVTNGSAPYTFRWTQSGTLVSESQNINGLTSGTYDILVLDANQCESTGSFTVPQPTTTFSLSGEVTPVTCNGQTNGSIDLVIEAPGHPDDYSIVWSKDSSFFAQNTEDLIGLEAGDYTTTIRDINGCIKSSDFTLVDPDPIDVTETVNHLSCYNSGDGSISLSVTGGYGGYSFSWVKKGEPTGRQSSYLTNLEGGIYTVQVLDEEGCLTSKSYEINQPSEIVVSYDYQSNSCNEDRDSEITVSVSGGTAPYHYEWKKDNILYSTEKDLHGLEEANYSLTVSDANQCPSETIDMTIGTPEPLEISITNLVQPKCPDTANGELSFEASGGSGDYEYTFGEQGVYSNHQTRLVPGAYPLSVKDKNGCQYDTLVTLDPVYDIIADFNISAEYLYQDIPITLVDHTTGKDLASWLWDFGDQRSSSEQNPAVTYENEGVYTIELLVENEQGCKSSKSKEILIEQGYNFVVPHAFTPNGDGLNDHFSPSFENIDALKMMIMDRNHRLVYQSNELSASWDGKYQGYPLPDGPYYYEMLFTAESGVSRTAKGKILIIR